MSTLSNTAEPCWYVIHGTAEKKNSLWFGKMQQPIMLSARLEMRQNVTLSLTMFHVEFHDSRTKIYRLTQKKVCRVAIKHYSGAFFMPLKKRRVCACAISLFLCTLLSSSMPCFSYSLLPLCLLVSKWAASLLHRSLIRKTRTYKTMVAWCNLFCSTIIFCKSRLCFTTTSLLSILKRTSQVSAWTWASIWTDSHISWHLQTLLRHICDSGVNSAFRTLF